MDVPPKEFCAVNEAQMGKGKLVVNVSGGVDYSQLRLTEVLHPPEVGFTPVSISHWDKEGSSVMQDGGKCIIRGQDGAEVGSHLTNKKGMQEHWPNSEKVAVEWSVCGDQMDSSVSHFEEESEGEAGKTQTDKPVVAEPLSRKLPLPIQH